ncbi:uncharacterized protein [Elaeis guineensis]|uniref:Uncharacterized protein LOC105059662 n=1 Tax=Elaeis guineensis var. tenera TaxID=51953 RepID=A0A6I9SDU1_ELAGV|nr:uncharacterized protein LOC105059662 [Elaeis guineensis]
MAMEAAVALPLLLFLLFSCHVSNPSLAQTPIPRRPDGFVYVGDPLVTDSIEVDAFLDPLCPDSRDSWLPLQKAVEFYFPRLSVVVHPFPLPYHNNAFLACRALHIANKLNESSTFPLLELFFKYQEKYYNEPTENMSRASIIDDMAKLAVTVVGSSLSEFLSGFKDSKTDTAARISFKYGCSRGVSGAPFFFVNGFLLPNAGSPIDYSVWRRIIDPILGIEVLDHMFSYQ